MKSNTLKGRRDMSKNMYFFGVGLVIILVAGIWSLVATIKLTANINKEYGVYIGADPESLLNRENLAQTIVIDAQYYTKQEIADLKAAGHTVYTYLNIGSVETFRDYYKEYESITLGAYENWEDERWVDVSQKAWQDFIADKAKELRKKGVDGFFVDNCDVYYYNHESKIFEGVCAILRDLHSGNGYVMINGGDDFVMDYVSAYGGLDDVLDGVNQESIYTSIDWENDSFSVNNHHDRDYFLKYLNLVKNCGKDRYAIEYTTSGRIAGKAAMLAKSRGYTVYIADSLELK